MLYIDFLFNYIKTIQQQNLLNRLKYELIYILYWNKDPILSKK